MKRALIGLSCLAFCLSAEQAAARKPRIAVAAFEDKASGGECYRGGRWLGSGFQEQLLTALAKSGKVQIYERAHIDKIYDQEHNLRNRNKRGGPRKNLFEAADYSIAGAVTAFESCFEGSSTGISVGGLLNRTLLKNKQSVGLDRLNVGFGSEKAQAIVDVRLVDVETGEIMKSISAEGTSNRRNVKLDTQIYGAGFSHRGFKNTPLGEATRDAIEDAAQQILAAIPDQVEDKQESATPD